jgi:TRAP-type C4-dicarboxylate transport system permease small subunit
VLDVLSRVTHHAAAWLLRLGAAGLVAMTAIVGWQVFGRYVLNSSPSWSEQSALLLMIWYVSFAAAAGVREGFHIRIVALERAVGGGVRRSMRVLNDLVVAACGAAMAVWGTELTIRTWSHVIPSLGLPRGVAYIALPLAGILIVLFSLERILEEMGGRNVEDEEDPRWS